MGLGLELELEELRIDLTGAAPLHQPSAAVAERSDTHCDGDGQHEQHGEEGKRRRGGGRRQRGGRWQSGQRGHSWCRGRRIPERQGKAALSMGEQLRI